MASVTANIAKGREVEFYDRVLNNDPANSAIIMGILVSGGDPLATLQDYDTLAAVLAGPSTEAAVTGYARKVLTNADLAAWTPDDSLNRVLLVLPQQSWTPDTGETWDIAFTAYDDDTTAGTDSDIIPIAFHEIRENTTGLAMPTITGDTIIVDFSNGWVLNS